MNHPKQACPQCVSHVVDEIRGFRRADLPDTRIVDKYIDPSESRHRGLYQCRHVCR